MAGWVKKANGRSVFSRPSPSTTANVLDLLQNLAALSDLQQALNTFADEGQSATKFLLGNPQASTLAGSQIDASVRLANEIAAVKKGKKVLVIVKNMAYAAFCISIMMKVCVHSLASLS